VNTGPVPQRPTTARDVHRPALDGLRAIAVALVLAFHLGHLAGGILGVDAFFVLSGWLITWKLLAEVQRDGTVHLRRFWAARIRRLLPASVAVLAVVAVVWPLAGIVVPSLRHDELWSLAWAANWGTITAGGDYWARFGNPSPLGHFWSLAIEEQFYLVWPVALLLATRWAKRPRLAVGVLAAAGSVASIAVMAAIFDPTAPTNTYMNTGARAHSLLIGAVAAAITAPRPDGGLFGGRLARWLSPLAAGGALLMILRAEQGAGWLFHWGFPVFAVLMAVVVVAAADGVCSSVLGSPPFRWLGDRSYALYLWHWPVFLFLTAPRLHVHGAALDVVRVTVACLLADLSLRFLEQPIRRRVVLPGRRFGLAIGLALPAVALLAVLAVPGPTHSAGPSVVTLPPVATEASTAPTTVPIPSTSLSPGGPTTSGTAAPTTAAPTTAAPTTTLPPGPVRVLVVGDSTAAELSTALIPWATAHPDQLVVGSAAFPGCGLSAADDGRLHELINAQGRPELLSLVGCLTQWQSVPVRVASAERIDVVLVQIGMWDSVDIHLPDGRVVSVADAAGQALVTDAYRQFAGAIEAAGATVVWVTPPDADQQWETLDAPVDDPARWVALRRIIDGLGVQQIDLPAWLLANDLTGPDGRPDGVHLSTDANERFVNEVVAPMLAALPRRPAA